MKKVNSHITKWIIGIIICIYFLQTTVFARMLEWNLRLEMLFYITFLLWIPFLWNLLYTTKGEVKYILKNNWMIILYFTVRCGSLFFGDFSVDQNALETIYYEIFGLIIIGYYSLKYIDNLNSVFKVYIFLNLIINILNIFIFYAVPKGVFAPEGGVVLWLTKYSSYASFPYASLYTNSNGAGILTGMAVVLAAAVFKKRKIFFWLYCTFSIYFMYLVHARSAQVALMVCGIGYVLMQLSKKKYIIKIFVTLVFVACVCMTAGLYGVVYKNSTDISKVEVMNPIEQELNQRSTGRYLIWKYDINTNKLTDFWGSGSVINSQNKRKDIFMKIYKDPVRAEQQRRQMMAFDFHNGYLGTISVCGVFAFILFLLILIKKVIQMDHEKTDYWLICACFMFVVNLFECQFLIETYVYSIILMLVLNQQKNNYNIGNQVSDI
ncbi:MULTISPECIES: O-antigen ligase family protein [Anaerostipes]|uniref:O-antigen ligase family protein n=2 Tax=Anaerostipes TaxID=207244 RepID=A0ABV4DG47_9FIRM|nr:MULTISPECIES: O-antigen ligase family protein [Anaerostipes]MBC5676466.1 O-antigen ligase family protein [Anaerostipes hominis (ex Liu et al. 2021)]